MVFENKMKELRTFITKWQAEGGIVALDVFLRSWERDTRQELQLPVSPNHTIGVSCADEMVLGSIPGILTVRPGFYISHDRMVVVEVQFESESQQVVFESKTPDSDVPTVGSMSSYMFQQLFDPHHV